jgi:hypothetical protein
LQQVNVLAITPDKSTIVAGGFAKIRLFDTGPSGHTNPVQPTSSG